MSDINFSGGKNKVEKEALKCLGWGRAEISVTVAKERLAEETAESRPDIWGESISGRGNSKEPVWLKSSDRKSCRAWALYMEGPL